MRTASGAMFVLGERAKQGCFARKLHGRIYGVPQNKCAPRPIYPFGFSFRGLTTSMISFNTNLASFAGSFS